MYRSRRELVRRVGVAKFIEEGQNLTSRVGVAKCSVGVFLPSRVGVAKCRVGVQSRCT